MFYIVKDLTIFVELKIEHSSTSKNMEQYQFWFSFHFLECMQSACADTSRAGISTQRNIIKRKEGQVYLYTNVYVYLNKNNDPFLKYGIRIERLMRINVWIFKIKTKKNVLVVKRYLRDKELLLITAYHNNLKYKLRLATLSDNI